VTEPGFTLLMAIVGWTPVPARLTVCGLFAALSAIVRLAVRLPVAVGVKVTLIVQLAPVATLDPQLLACAKSPGFVPATAIEEIVRATLPLLVSVTGCEALGVPTAWLLKVKLLAETPATGAVPVPVRLTVCGLPLALSVIVRVPVRVPVAVGVKVTLIVQEPVAATPLAHVLVSEKSPLAATLAMVSVAVPVLLSVTGCGALVVATI
jgi:hypothetical protein